MKSASKVLARKLAEWRSDGPLVVGLEGYSGMGKTTLSENVAAITPFVDVLHMDNYATTANTKEQLLPQIESEPSTLKLEWKPKDGVASLKEAVCRFKNEQSNKRRILVVDGVFLCHPDVLNDFLDKRIYVDGNVADADSRSQKRERERWGDAYVDESDPDSYARLFKVAYQRYIELYKPAEKADLILSMG